MVMVMVGGQQAVLVFLTDDFGVDRARVHTHSHQGRRRREASSFVSFQNFPKANERKGTRPVFS